MNSNNNMIYIGEITFGIAIFLVVYLLYFLLYLTFIALKILLKTMHFYFRNDFHICRRVNMKVGGSDFDFTRGLFRKTVSTRFWKNFMVNFTRLSRKLFFYPSFSLCEEEATKII